MKKSLSMLAMVIYTCANAQSIHYNQFDAMPAAVNPANTGMFNGTLRASVLYRNSFGNDATQYTTKSMSTDLPLFTLENGSCLSAGGQVTKDERMIYSINYALIASVAFHAMLKYDSTPNGEYSSVISAGIQAGYLENSIDLNTSNIYFEHIYQYPYPYYSGSELEYNVVNGGISFSQAYGNKFSYTIGLSGIYLNQPNDMLLKKYYERDGYDRNYKANAALSWSATKKITIKPAIFYVYHSRFSDIIAGSEFVYKLARHPKPNKTCSVFMGLWYRSNTVAIVTAGAEYRRFRLGISYDHSVDSYLTTGFEVAVRYIAPGGKRRSSCKLPQQS